MAIIEENCFSSNHNSNENKGIILSLSSFGDFNFHRQLVFILTFQLESITIEQLHLAKTIFFACSLSV